MNPDDKLDEIFRTARMAAHDPRGLGFETRLRAAIRAERQRRESPDFWIWRLAPIGAAIALLAGVWFAATPSPDSLSDLAMMPPEQRSLACLFASN